jgi:glycosyltransferase involved in cell wall biosynthesis
MSIDDPRVRVYSDGRNKRLAARLNEIVRLARFEYIARMDADDLMSRERIERQLGILAVRNEIDLVSAGVISMANDFHALGMRCVSEGHSISRHAVLAGQSGIVHAAVLGRRAWFLRNLYDERLKVSEDTNLWIRSCGKKDLRMKVLPEPLYFYREDGNVTYPKLRTAYQELRNSIIDAASGYSILDRAYVYAIAWTKSAVAFAAHLFGRMDLIRARRNATDLTGEQRHDVELEVNAILATEVPVKRERKSCNGN